MPARRTPAPEPERGSRSDGLFTRAHLLETAGALFAERGVAQTTSKQICEQAGVNLAAVNYHFGSKEGLYEAVLIEAHRQIVGLEELTAWAAGDGEPRDKLRVLLVHLVGLVARRQESWAFRVLLREMLNPSPAMPALLAKAVRPKLQVMLQLVAGATGRAVDDPVVHRCLFFSIVPNIVMAVAPPPLRTALLAPLHQDPDGTAADFVAFAMAGLDALSSTRPDARKPRRP